MIKLDLHIHSRMSKYKESNKIVDESTKENVHTLLRNLEKFDVGLFSITDHNRFNVELYKKIDKILNSVDCDYKKVKNILSGVEFDVQIDSTMGKCHIIAIFDTGNNPENYERINTAINNNMLVNKEDFYTKEKFEQLLRDIGLGTILIASQRKNIHNHNGNHNSLSDSSKKVEDIIRVGYIKALEYQKPKVEGILKNNLKELPSSVSLIAGSDCHMWSSYPHHDNINKKRDFHFSKAKILPTFKGLLMAITSPKTRFNFKENKNPFFIKGITTKNRKIPLRNGINAIIGENGSGKSTVLKLLNNNIKEPFVQKIIENNKLEKENFIEETKIRSLGQGDVIERFNKNTLFDSTNGNFKEIDHSEFFEEYNKFAQQLKKKINKRIKQKESIDVLGKNIIEYKPELEAKNYYIHLNSRSGFDDISNIHREPLNRVKKLIKDIRKMESNSYYNNFMNDIKEVESVLIQVYQKIKEQWETVKLEAEVKNIIKSSISDYNLKTNENSSARDKEKKEYTKKRQNIIDAVIDAIELSNDNEINIKKPEIKNGRSRNTKKGFSFNRVTEYNNVSMLDNFLSHMFNKDYQKLESIFEINSSSEYVKAIRNCTSKEDIEVKMSENFDKFMESAKKVKEYITDGSSRQLGNTLGEMSLSYYKYYTQDSEDWNIFIIDQPEDHISNNNISKNLMKFFNSMRYDKQLIIVTHNPLLVVNLDVDNVIYISNNRGKLSFENGCLEYEDENTNILELIAHNMDGGKESIEKRLKVYGK